MLFTKFVDFICCIYVNLGTAKKIYRKYVYRYVFTNKLKWSHIFSIIKINEKWFYIICAMPWAYYNYHMSYKYINQSGADERIGWHVSLAIHFWWPKKLHITPFFSQEFSYMKFYGENVRKALLYAKNHLCM